MCGIAGFYGFNDRGLIRRMASVLEHRGPDDRGYYESENVSLGHRRLSIIDLSKAGKQPMSNEDGTVWVTYNGEIYNFKELRAELEKKDHRFASETDTEVIVHGYEEWGFDCLKRFRGMFAFGLWDERKKALFLARDRLGIKPLYYYYDGERLIFASEIKAILEAGIPREVNWGGVYTYLTFRYVEGGKSIFKDINRLEPGNYIVLNKGLVKKKYWDISVKPGNSDENSLKERVFNELKDSVSMRLVSDVPLGVYLSGGIDSSSVVGMMHEAGVEDIKTFSVGFGEPGFDELNYAKKVSDMYSTSHREFIVKKDIIEMFPKIIWHFEEPIADPTLFPTYLLSEKARKYVKVVLTGEGGDEIFAGYEQYKLLLMARRLRVIPRGLRSLIPKVAGTLPAGVLDRLFRYGSSLGEEAIKRFNDVVMNAGDSSAGYLAIMSIFDEKEKGELSSKNIPMDMKSHLDSYFRRYDLLNSLMYYEAKNPLVNHLLMKVDKMTMANSIEARVPLLDHKFVNLAFGVPSGLKLNGRRDKYIFRKSVRRLLPEEVFRREKQRFFVPIDKWLEKDLSWLADGILSRNSVERRGYLNHKPISRIFEKFRKSRLYYSRQLWSLLSLEVWFRMYVDGMKEKDILK